MLTLCGFLVAEAPVCLKRSGFENPERAWGGALEWSWGHLAGRTGHSAGRGATPGGVGCCGRRVPFSRPLGTGLLPSPSFSGELQSSNGSLCTAWHQAWQHEASWRRPPSPHPHMRPAAGHQGHRALFPGQNVPSTKRSSTTNRLLCAWSHHGTLFSSDSSVLPLLGAALR